MTMQFRCPHCGAVITAPETAAGREGPCPQCQKRVQAPPASADTAAPPTPPSSASLPPEAPATTKACPQCGKPIRAAATYCKHCRTAIPLGAETAPPSGTADANTHSVPPPRTRGLRNPWTLAVGVVGLLVFLTLTFRDYRAATGGRTDTDKAGGRTGTGQSVPRAAGGAGEMTFHDLYAAAKPVSFDDLARNADQLRGKTVILTGQVLQVVTEEGNRQELRVALTDTDEGWEDAVYVTYDRSEGGARVLEEDIIDVWGTVQGMAALEMTDGTQQQVPEVAAWFVQLASHGMETTVEKTLTPDSLQLEVHAVTRYTHSPLLGKAPAGSSFVLVTFTVTNTSPTAFATDNLCCRLLPGGEEALVADVTFEPSEAYPDAPAEFAPGQSYAYSAAFYDVPYTAHTATFRVFDVTSGSVSITQYADLPLSL